MAAASPGERAELPAPPPKDSPPLALPDIEPEEGRVVSVTGRFARVATVLAISVSLFHLYAAVAGAWPLKFAPPVTSDVIRYVHAGGILLLAFMLIPWRSGSRPGFGGIGLGVVAACALVYAWAGGSDFNERAIFPTMVDVLVGLVFIVILLEATRRATSWIVPAIALVCILYAYVGPWLPAPWTHRGYGIPRIVGHLFMTNEGVFGFPLYVSATLIILFTIYGAVLHHAGAGKFFIDVALRLVGRSRNGPGRAVVLASFLLGGPSGSGTATTVMLGSVSAPMLKKGGMSANEAGGLLAAGGIGAVLSPPVMGAAAFLIAQFLNLTYLDIIWMAIVPTAFYYFALLLMVEVRKHAIGEATVPRSTMGWRELVAGSPHFVSLFAIVIFLVLGFSASLAAVWAIVVAVVLSFLSRENRLGFRKLGAALSEGAISVIGVAATCATAGIIVGIVTMTGLGLKFSAIVIGFAGGSLVLAALFSAFIVWFLGLAVPISASYIISAVVVAPALMELGVPDYAAHMFIFYYAVLSEVSPPTAMAPLAASAITGGDPVRTTMQAWKFTLPGFLLPFVFVLDPRAVGLLLQVPAGGSWVDVLEVTARAFIGIAAVTVGIARIGNHLHTRLQAAVLTLSGLSLLFPVQVLNLFALNLPAYAEWAGTLPILAILILQMNPARKASAPH